MGGIRVGTAIGWPDSEILDRLKISAFTHLVALVNATQISPNVIIIGGVNASAAFDKFIFGGQAEMKTKKLWMEDISWQMSVDGYEVILDKVPRSEERRV